MGPNNCPETNVSVIGNQQYIKRPAQKIRFIIFLVYENN